MSYFVSYIVRRKPFVLAASAKLSVDLRRVKENSTAKTEFSSSYFSVSVSPQVCEEIKRGYF